MTSSRQSLYRLYGLTFASDFPFTYGLSPGERTAADSLDFIFTCVDQAPITANWRQTAPAYTSPYRDDKGASRLYLYRLDSCDVLHFPDVADFCLWQDRIVCHLLNPSNIALIEANFLSSVLAFWLERKGVLALHASAVVTKGGAVAFLSNSGDGKSALAATMMQTGCTLLTDDILPVEQQNGSFLGRAGFPTMRMWPDEAQHFLRYYQDLKLVHPNLSKRRVPIGPGDWGTFCDVSRPLTCLYIPKRRDATQTEIAVEITPLSPGEAVIELVRHSFTARIVEALGLQARRLKLFAQIVRQVPVRWLVYPSGFEHLARVREAILVDLSRQSQSPG